MEVTREIGKAVGKDEAAGLLWTQWGSPRRSEGSGSYWTEG